MSDPTKYTESYFELDDEYTGVSAADGMEEESILKAQHAQLATITQVLMNMLIYLSQGGAFTRGDMVTTKNTFDS